MFKTPNSDKVKQILKIAAPCIAEQLLMFSVSIVSVVIIGHLGSGELVASAMTNTIVGWLQSIYIGLSSGGTVVIARMWGSGDKQGTKKCFMQTLIITAAISAAILLSTMVFQKQVVSLFFGNAHDDILDKINIYFFYSMIGMPATAVATVVNAGVRGVGDNKTPFFTTIVLNIINLALSFILIYGIPSIGISPMGIAGAGIAVSCAKYISMIFSILIILYKKSPILPEKLIIRFEKDIIVRILRIGVPSMLEQLIFNGGFVILQSMLIGFGTAFQGGYQIGTNLNGLINAPVLGLGVAVTVLVSHALGRRDVGEADEIVRISRFLTICVFVFLGLMLFIFAPIITRIYTSDPEVLKSGTFFARVFGVILIPIAYFQIMAAILKGSGDVRYVAVTSIAGLWVMRIFGVWLIGRLTGNGYIAVVIGLSSDFVLRAFMYHIRVKKGKWKYIRV